MTIIRSPLYFFDLLTTLVERELRIRYKGSLLGLLWALLSPLGTVLIMYLVFSRVLSLNIPHYAAFIYSGLLPWTWFQAAIQTSAATLFDNRDLVRKPFFPRPVLPAVVTSTNFLLYLLALPVLLILLWVEGVPLTPMLAWLPVVWIVQALFTLACAMLVAALGTLMRDIQHFLGVGLLLWFYLTPIFYDLNRIGDTAARWLLLNPMTILVQAHRDVTFLGQPPNLAALGLCAAGSTLLLLVSLTVFRALEDSFVEVV